MEDDLIFFVNERLPKNGGQPQLFLLIKFFLNGGQPHFFLNGRRPRFVVNKKIMQPETF